MSKLAVAALAAARFKHGTFEDPITLQRVGKSRGVVLNKQMYDARAMREAMMKGHVKVPHSRRPLVNREVAEIVRKSRTDTALFDTLARPELPPTRLKGRHFVRAREFLVRGAMKEVSDAVSTDCWALVFVPPTGAKQVIFNRYPFRGELNPREERARAFIDKNPGSVLKRLRATPGLKAAFYFNHDVGAVMFVSYKGNGVYLVEDFADYEF